MSKRDSLRSAVLGTKPVFAKEVVKIGDQEFEIRQPTVKARNDTIKRAMPEPGKLDMMEYTLWAVINNTYEPGTNELVFEPSDYDVLVGLPSGGVLDQLGEVAIKLLNVDQDIEKK